MRHLTVEQRAQIVGMSLAGSSNKSIARAFAIDMKTVARWINRYQIQHRSIITTQMIPSVRR